MRWRAGEPVRGATNEINPQRGHSVFLRGRTVRGDRTHSSESRRLSGGVDLFQSRAAPRSACDAALRDSFHPHARHLQAQRPPTARWPSRTSARMRGNSSGASSLPTCRALGRAPRLDDQAVQAARLGASRSTSCPIEDASRAQSVGGPSGGNSYRKPLSTPPTCRVSSAVEQRFCKPLVGGSIPSPGTNEIKDLSRYFYRGLIV